MSMPMVRAPPGRLSTTTFCPSCLLNSGARVRETLSVALPAAWGTTSRIGRSGYCALALPAAASSARCSRIDFKSLRGELAAHFAALVGGGVDVDVQAAILERFHLRVVQLGAGGHGVGVAALRERDDDRAVLALRALVDVRHGALDAGGGDAAAHRPVRLHLDGAATGSLDARRRDFLGPAELHADRAAPGQPARSIVLVGGAGREQARGRDEQNLFHHRKVSCLMVCSETPRSARYSGGADLESCHAMAKISASSALARFRILDLSRVRAGPTCVKQFADFGADVIKIESPPGVDPNEGMGGPRQGPDFQNLHRNKRAMTLNLKLPEARELFGRLVKTADVVVENLRPDVKYRLGLDYQSLERLNPRIILA